jgi:hypothetical protein
VSRCRSFRKADRGRAGHVADSLTRRHQRVVDLDGWHGVPHRRGRGAGRGAVGGRAGELTRTAADYLADDLGLDVADLAVVLDWLGHPADELDPAACDDVRAILNDEHARTVPELFGLAAPDWRTADE